MNLKNWFAKEHYIRLTDEGDGFVSTLSYSVMHPKGPILRFKRMAQFVMDGKSARARAELLAPFRLLPKS
jgi:hypothetical protein